MSSDSEEEQAIIFRQDINDDKLNSSDSLSSDSLSSSSSDAEGDRLLQTLKRSSNSKFLRSSPLKKSKSIQLQKFDLGGSFDPHLASSLDRIQNINNEIDRPSHVTTVKEQKSNDIKSKISPNDISSQYIDLVAKETISGCYIDWHFIIDDTKFEDVGIDEELLQDSTSQVVNNAIRERYRTLSDLLKSFGVDLRSLEKDSPLTDQRDYDSLCEITPVDSMMRAIHCYQDDVNFIKYFLCFILDRKIWESQECDADWCSQVLETIDDRQVIATYLSLVDRSDYFMHYRLSRCVPRLQSPLVDQLMEGRSIDKEFNYLISGKHYRRLLYFTLLVYGSNEMPFGPSTRTQHFKDCVEDMCNEGTNAVELSLLRGLLNLFLKIRSF